MPPKPNPPPVLHWVLLGVNRGAAPSNLAAARRQLARQHHPDVTNNDPASAQRMALINVAYDTLLDPKKEKLYVAQLRSTHVDCANCKGVGVFGRQKGFNKKIYDACPVCAGCGLVLKEKK